jgi:soluble lytic murein transglycosylase-like protein
VSLADVLTRIEQLAPQLQAQPAAAPAPTPTTADVSFADTLALAQDQQGQSTSDTNLPSAAAPYQAEIDSAAQENGLDPALLASVIEQESGFDTNATSSAGAQGLM